MSSLSGSSMECRVFTVLGWDAGIGKRISVTEISPSAVWLNAGESQTLVERGSPYSEVIVVVVVVVVVVVFIYSKEIIVVGYCYRRPPLEHERRGKSDPC